MKFCFNQRKIQYKRRNFDTSVMTGSRSETSVLNTPRSKQPCLLTTPVGIPGGRFCINLLHTYGLLFPFVWGRAYQENILSIVPKSGMEKKSR